MKIVIENAILRGSPQDVILQVVATVYVGNEEYRVYAPPRATGNALEWVMLIHRDVTVRRRFVGGVTPKASTAMIFPRKHTAPYVERFA